MDRLVAWIEQRYAMNDCWYIISQAADNRDSWRSLDVPRPRLLGNADLCAMTGVHVPESKAVRTPAKQIQGIAFDACCRIFAVYL